MGGWEGGRVDVGGVHITEQLLVVVACNIFWVLPWRRDSPGVGKGGGFFRVDR